MQEVEFRHESIHDQASIVAYLTAVLEGLSKGSLVLKDKRHEVQLNPKGLLLFSVEAKRWDDQCELALRVSWSEDEPWERDSSLLSIQAG